MGVIVRQKVKGKDQPWWVFVSHDNKRTSRKVGDKKAAEAVASQIREKLKMGEFGFKPEKKIPLFKDYAEGFMGTYSAMNHKPATQQSYQSSLDHYLIPEFGHMPLDEIKRKHVKEFIQRLHTETVNKRQKGKGPKEVLKPATIRNHKAYLSAIMSEAVDDELIESNPVSRTGKHIQRGIKDEINPLTWEESVSYLEAAEKHYPKHYPMCLTLLRTGMRLGEVIALQPGDLDFNGRFIEVRRGFSKGEITTPKSHHRRRVDMSQQLSEVLKAHLKEAKKDTLKNGWKEPPEYVFYGGYGGRVDEDRWRRKIHAKVLGKAGLRHVRIHDLRHTYATLRLTKGDNILDVSKQLGHASVKMTLDVYAHWMPGAKKSQVDELDSTQAPGCREGAEGLQKTA